MARASRTSGAYGAVFGVFLKQKLAGKPFTVVGDGTQRRDFLYASDVAGAFLSRRRTDNIGQVWNLGAGNPQSVNRLVELIGGPVTVYPEASRRAGRAPGRISAKISASSAGARGSRSKRGSGG